MGVKALKLFSLASPPINTLAAESYFFAIALTSVSASGNGHSSSFRVALIHNNYKLENVMLDPTDLTRITTVLDLGNGDSRGPEASSRVTTSFWIILSVFGSQPPLCQKSVLELTENTDVKS